MKVFLKYSNANTSVGGAISTSGYSVYSGSINLGQVTHTNLVNGIILDGVPNNSEQLTLIPSDPICNGTSFSVPVLLPVNSMQIYRTSSSVIKMRLTFAVDSSLGVTGIYNVPNSSNNINATLVWESSNGVTTPGYPSGYGVVSNTTGTLDASMMNRAKFEIKSYNSFTGAVTPTTIQSKYSTNSSYTVLLDNSSFIANGVANIVFNINATGINIGNIGHIKLQDFRIRCVSSIYTTNNSFTMNLSATNAYMTGGDSNRNVTFNAYDIIQGEIRPCAFFANFT